MQFLYGFRAKLFAVPPVKFFLVMRLTAFLLLFCSLHLSARVSSQITLKEQNASLEKVLEKAQQQSGYLFFYTSETLKNTKPVSIEVNNVDIKTFLWVCLQDQLLDFTIDGQTVFISRTVEIKKINTKSHFNPSIELPPISGHIVNEKGEPVAGATITIKGTKRGTTTNVDGSFNIDASEEDILIISSIGYNQKEIKVKGNNIGEINLIVANIELQEVVVNKGYYQTKRELETGNVATVTSKEIERQPVSNPLAALTGRVPGLEISQSSGAPGSGFKVQIRGRSSINGAVNNDPLYVIDGIQYPSRMPYGSANPNLLDISPLSFINVSDIETIDVLKDADATAIYGSRGASGVILITTKKGKSGKMKIDAGVYAGIGKITRSIDMMNTEQYLEMRREAFKNDNVEIPTVPTAGKYDVTYWDQNRNINWTKELLGKHAGYFDAQANISGGSGNTQYLFGTGLHQESSVFAANGKDSKASCHFSLNTATNDHKLQISIKASYLADINNTNPYGFSREIITQAPNAPELYKDGKLNWEPLIVGQPGTFFNPLGQSNSQFTGKTNTLTANTVLTYSILNNLSFRLNAGYNNSRTDEVTTNPSTTVDPARAATYTSSATYFNNSFNSWMLEPQLDYNFSIGKAKISALIGSAFQSNHKNFSRNSGSGYSNDIFLTNPLAAITYTRIAYGDIDYKYNGVYGRFNLNWENKYIINLTARRDGSSRFGPANRWANFGAIGLGWIFSKERFIENNLSWLSFGKMRMSFGSTGNDDLPDYLYLNLFYPSNNAYLDLKGVSPSGHFNPYLQWELTKKLEFGIEVGLLQDRINLSTSYYRNRTGNQLLSTPLSGVTGFTLINTNLPAVVENSGIELVVNTKNISNKNFTWFSAINMSLPKNKLLSVQDYENFSYKDYEIGQPITIRKVYVSAGVNPDNGIQTFRAIDGKVVTYSELKPQDRSKLVNLSPKYTAGLQNNFSYRGFELGLFFQYVKQLGTGVFVGSPGNALLNLSTKYQDRWRKPGDIAKYQKVSQGFDVDHFFADFLLLFNQVDMTYEDASFLRLKNLYLGWNLPSKISSHIGLNALKIYAQGQNLLTFTRYSGYDPETQSTVVPPIKVFTIGIKISL
jgi:TonB-dependent starch-binding outer membrane protein SusC